MFSHKIALLFLVTFIAFINCHQEEFLEAFTYAREGRTECLEDESEFNEFGGGKKFFFSRFYDTWFGAAATCHKYGLRFLKLESAYEHDLLLDILDDSELKDYVYIGGLKKTNATDNDWIWEDCGNDVKIRLKWKKEKPAKDGMCLAAKRNDDSKKYEFVEWKCEDGDKKYAYFCQK